MTTNFEQQLSQIVEAENWSIELDSLTRGYRFCAQSEGKSEKTIRITTTAVNRLSDFLKAKGLSTAVTEIGDFIIHLQLVKAFEHHPFTRRQDKGLSGQGDIAINCYLRALRAFWSWLVRDEIITSNPFTKVRIPKPPRKVIPTISPDSSTSLNCNRISRIRPSRLPSLIILEL